MFKYYFREHYLLTVTITLFVILVTGFFNALLAQDNFSLMSTLRIGLVDSYRTIQKGKYQIGIAYSSANLFEESIRNVKLERLPEIAFGYGLTNNLSVNSGFIVTRNSKYTNTNRYLFSITNTFHTELSLNLLQQKGMKPNLVIRTGLGYLFNQQNEPIVDETKLLYLNSLFLSKLLVTWGYEIKEKWAISGNLGYDALSYNGLSSTKNLVGSFPVSIRTTFESNMGIGIYVGAGVLDSYQTDLGLNGNGLLLVNGGTYYQFKNRLSINFQISYSKNKRYTYSPYNDPVNPDESVNRDLYIFSTSLNWRIN